MLPAINPKNLLLELHRAALPVVSVDAAGVILYFRKLTAQEEITASDVISAHKGEEEDYTTQSQDIAMTSLDAFSGQKVGDLDLAQQTKLLEVLLQFLDLALPDGTIK